MFGAQVTLTTSGTVYNLYTLVHAVDAAIPQNAHQVIIQSDVSNSGINVYIGGKSLGADGPGTALLAGDTANLEAVFNGVVVSDVYLKADQNNAKINVSQVTI